MTVGSALSACRQFQLLRRYLGFAHDLPTSDLAPLLREALALAASDDKHDLSDLQSAALHALQACRLLVLTHVRLR